MAADDRVDDFASLDADRNGMVTRGEWPQSAASFRAPRHQPRRPADVDRVRRRPGRCLAAGLDARRDGDGRLPGGLPARADRRAAPPAARIAPATRAGISTASASSNRRTRGIVRTLARASSIRPAIVPRSASATAKASVRAERRTLRDVIAPDLDVLFCGINPGLYSAATGWHFARPGNRFWPALAAAGFTRVAPPQPASRAARPAASASPTSWPARPRRRRADRRRDWAGRPSASSGRSGAIAPRAVAIVGIGAYRIAFGRPRAAFGRQTEDLAGALLWVLPNTSGLNAHYQAAGFARAFAELRDALTARPRR